MSDTTNTSDSGDPDDDVTDASPVAALSDHLRDLRDHILRSFPAAVATAHRGELTLTLDAAELPAVLTYCKDDAVLRCEMLADIGAVHWPAGVTTDTSQETTGWPTYTEVNEVGRIQVDYIVRSIAHNHQFRLRVNADDDNPVVPTATGVYSSANFLEREVYDLMGVTFQGHPALTRIMMPEDWDGHPHRKDYPLGGVEIMYKGQTVAPPDERDY